VRNPKCPNCRNSNTSKKYFSNKFWLYFCHKCGNGFCYPVPKDLAKYYPENYWTFSSFLVWVRGLVYGYFQARRMKWVKELLAGGTILDVGAGEAEFGRSLAGSFQVTSIEAPFAKISNKEVLKFDFLKWNPRQKFDMIVFWESLEHTPAPEKYIRKAFRLLSDRGFILVEYPRFECLESKIFGKFWYHLDLPRHLAHFTDVGLRRLILANNLELTSQRSVFAPEYTIAGLAASILNVFKWPILDLPTKAENSPKYILTLVILLPLLVLAALAEVIFFGIGQSPIGVIVVQKSFDEKN